MLVLESNHNPVQGKGAHVGHSIALQRFLAHDSLLPVRFVSSICSRDADFSDGAPSFECLAMLSGSQPVCRYFCPILPFRL